MNVPGLNVKTANKGLNVTLTVCKTCNGRGKVQGGYAGETLEDCPDCGNNRPEKRAERLAAAENAAKPFWWMPRRTDPTHAGWYYVREVRPRLCIGIRYFDDSQGSWWAISKDGKNDGSLVPNETFHDWLTIPNISDRQRS